jgi:hypothetical protein
MGICMQTPLLSLLLNLVLSVRKVMLPIEDLMVDGGCIATTGGRRLFCLLFYSISIQMCVQDLLELNVSRNMRYDIVSTYDTTII